MAPDIADPVVPVGSTADSCQTARQRMPAAHDDNNNQIEKQSAIPASHEDQFRPEIRWPDFIAQAFLHAGFLIGVWQLVTLQAKLYTVGWTLILIWGSGVGITAGAHRLWSHKSYKAKWPLRVLHG